MGNVPLMYQGSKYKPGKFVPIPTPPAPSGPVPILDLEADTLSAGAVATWAGSEVAHHTFTASGDARPTAQLINGVMAVTADGIDDVMVGPNDASLLDNMASFTVICVGNPTEAAHTSTYISKEEVSENYDANGWQVFITYGGRAEVTLYSANEPPNYLKSQITSATMPLDHPFIFSSEWFDLSSTPPNNYINGVVDNDEVTIESLIQYSTTEIMRLFGVGGVNGVNDSGYAAMDLYAIRIYSPALSPTDRVAVEAELAARYGITL